MLIKISCIAIVNCLYHSERDKPNQTSEPNTAQPTDECAEPEGPEWHTDDGTGDVDKPVGKEGSDAQEDNVEQQIVSLLVHLQHTNTQ